MQLHPQQTEMEADIIRLMESGYPQEEIRAQANLWALEMNEADYAYYMRVVEHYLDSNYWQD